MNPLLPFATCGARAMRHILSPAPLKGLATCAADTLTPAAPDQRYSPLMKAERADGRKMGVKFHHVRAKPRWRRAHTLEKEERLNQRALCVQSITIGAHPHASPCGPVASKFGSQVIEQAAQHKLRSKGAANAAASELMPRPRS